jgi:hypothetical protein
MGLIINATEEKSITIVGTEITLESVYGRIEFAGRADGKTLEIAIATYASKEAFESGASALSTDVPQGNFTVEILPTEIQSIDTAHEYGKQAFEQMGYEVVIDLTA